MSLHGRDLLSVHELSYEEVQEIFRLTKIVKDKQKNGQEHHILKGKTLGMIFQKSSTRTRVSFEVGMWQLGGMAMFLSANDLQIGRGEPVKDTARVLSRYVDGIMIRTFSHQEVEELAQYASVPVINGLTDLLHPCQALTDVYTAIEHKGEVKGRKMAYIGDGNNMANSLMYVCAKVGMNIAVATPSEYKPNESVVSGAREDARLFGSSIELTNDPYEAVKDADIVYTDVWASMGEKSKWHVRWQALARFQVNSELLGVAKPDAIVMHCLPAHRGEEITDEVMESKQSVVFDEAENRLHVQKAIMALLMGHP
ncbi:ornithine carbamoyltransferase [Acetonema longum]|uniref:Ornithine carbamoyltransferase n=1 Tax=Acetonema longum DSM 6540 TaxID=1009370 RepID=F7NF50_9FIRM|nr:ornithine carbamoyltransferase [Acetonema longum]EGO65305.1 ornithine carbamoyltransferase [Acetonema longum DSM 6540]